MIFGGRIEYLKAGNVMTCALQLLLICCAALLLSHLPLKISLKVTSFQIRVTKMH
jgi:hypothetical protein